MQNSTIKSTPGDCLRVLYRRKTLIILPLLGIACCFAFYSFRIADEIFKTENSLLVLDEKTGKPLLNDPAATSEAARRVERSVGRVVSRSGTLAIIAGVERLANQFPDSEALQGRRLEVLREKQAVLEFRMQALDRRKLSLNDKLLTTEDSHKRRLIVARMRELIDAGTTLDRRKRNMEQAITLADRRLGEIRREAAGFESMGFGFQSGRADEGLAAEYDEYLARREATNRRLEEFAARFEENLTLRFVAGTVAAAYESADPLVCRDVVDEVLYRVECESIGATRDEIRDNGETLAQRIENYEKALARQKALQAEIHSLKEQMKIVPPVVEHTVHEGEPETLSLLKTRLAELRMERSRMLATGAAQDAEIKKLNSQIEHIENTIRGSSTLEVSSIERERNPYYDDLANRLAIAERELQGVEQDIRICKLRLDGLDESSPRAPQIAGVGGIRFEKSAPTFVPVAPFKPNRRAMILLGLALGVVAAALALAVAEYADRTIRDRSNVTRVLGLPLLGTVPTFERHRGEVRPARRLTARSVLVGCAALVMVVGLVVAFAHGEKTGAPGQASTATQGRPVAEDRDATLLSPEITLVPERDETEKRADSTPANSTSILPVFESDAETDAPQQKEAVDE